DVRRGRSAMAIPELRQFGDLSFSDFDRHSVWIACHTADNEEPWYEETDEETFRPWTRGFPANSSDGILLVCSIFELRDGSLHRGFVTPAVSDGDLGTMQPQIFVGHRRFSFWRGMTGITTEERRAFYEALGK